MSRSAAVTDPANQWRPELHSGLRMEVIEGEAIVLDHSNDRVHHLNELATFILGQCTGELMEGEIVAAVVEAYAVDRAAAARDTRHLLGEMRDLGIIK